MVDDGDDSIYDDCDMEVNVDPSNQSCDGWYSSELSLLWITTRAYYHFSMIARQTATTQTR
jgi:hypothetical protein